MTKGRVYTILTGLLILVSLTLEGQQSNTFYLMHQVPQSNLLNPAVQLDCKWYVGIPGLASTHLSYSNTAFSYNDLAGSDTWNVEGIFNQMHRVDLYSVEAMLHPVSIGYKRKLLYFTFNITEKAHAYQTVPKSSMEMAFYGNGSFVGETARFNALRPAAYYMREYSLGISRIMDEKLTVGIRAKLLFGKASLYTNRSRGKLITGEDNFDLTLNGDYRISSSFPVTLEHDDDGYISDVILEEYSIAQLLLNRGNPGFALDLGAIYHYDEKITLSASLLDLGFVRWRTDVNNVRGTGSFEFEGATQGIEFLSLNFALEMRDSVMETFDIEISEEPYFSSQPTQLFLGADYQLNEIIGLGVVNRNVIFRHKVHSSLTLRASVDLAERILATVSWSYLNNTIRNLGIGLAYHGKGFQFHAVTDNLTGFFYPFNTRSINLRVGMNVMFGCPRIGPKKLQSKSYGPQRRGDCSWTGNKKTREEMIKRIKKRK